MGGGRSSSEVIAYIFGLTVTVVGVDRKEVEK